MKRAAYFIATVTSGRCHDSTRTALVVVRVLTALVAKFKAPHSWLGDGVLQADYSWSRVPHPMQIRYLQDDIEECANYRIKQEKRKAGRSWIQTWANRLDSAFDLYYQLRALDIPMQGILKYFNEARTTRKIKRKNRELDCEGCQLYCAQKCRTVLINH